MSIRLLYLFGGILAGLSELLIAPANAQWWAVLLVAMISAAIFGLLGLIVGEFIVQLGRWLGTGTARIVLTVVQIVLLYPMFAGQSFDLVFSEAQTKMILVAVIPLIYCLTFPTIFQIEPRNKKIELLLFLGSLLGLSTLTWLSSIFMIRLWGFHTMEYLQAMVVYLKIVFGARIVKSVLPGLFIKSQRIVLSGVIAALFLWFILGITSSIPSQVHTFISKAGPNLDLLLSFTVGTIDRDGDGYGGFVGFGDCNDRDATINPGAVDLPADGVDQNCFGGDLADIRHRYFNTPIDFKFAVESARKPRLVVVLLIDTLRLDYATPLLEPFKNIGTVFENTYAQSNNTLESFPFLFHLGFRNLPRYNPNWTLLPALTSNNIFSHGILQASVPEWWGDGFHQVIMGFDNTTRPSTQVRSWSSQEHALKTVSILENLEHKDTLIFTHFEALHDYFTQSMEGGRMIQRGLNFNELVRLLNFPQMQHVMKERYTQVVDSLYEPVISIWKSAKKLEETFDLMFVLTSDHGEEFGDHGGFFHMGTLYQELVRVPLAIYCSNCSPRIENSPVGLYQLGPTILDFFGFEGELMQKTSLLRKQPNNGANIFGYFSISERAERRSYMVVQEGYKLILDQRSGKIELYNLAIDPDETNDLSYDSSSHAIRERLIKLMDTTLFYMNYGDEKLLQIMEEAKLRVPQ